MASLGLLLSPKKAFGALVLVSRVLGGPPRAAS